MREPHHRPWPPGAARSATFIALLLANTITIAVAQTTCNNGQGRVLYERLPNQQLQGFDDDVVRDTAPPFRVLEKCQDLCLRDRTATNNLVRACTSFDFQPGSRIASFSGSAEYEESTCYLTREEPAPEGIGILMLVPNSVHFTEVCLSSSRPERECPSRRYVFERHPRKKLKLPVSDIKEISAANRSDCEDKCLNEFSFVCRSANFDSTLRSCALSRFTRRTHPELLEDDPNSDYLENTCLNAERRCDGLAVYVKEENKRLGGPFEVDIFNNMTLEECQSMCIRAEKYFCRSVEFDDQTKQCILSEEDSISQKDDISISSSPTHHFYDLVCLDNQRGTEYPDNSPTSHLFSSGRRPDTAFQRYRNSRLGGEFHSEITGRSLSECLDECLRQTSFQCRSAVYSDRFRTCRLSRYNQRDGMRIIYDADYDYYENLMPVGGDGTEDRDRDQDRDRNRPAGRPGDYPPVGGNGIYRPGDSDRDNKNRDRYPATDTDNTVANRYQPSDGKNDYGTRAPTGQQGTTNKGPADRYPAGGDRYPPAAGDVGGRYPYDERYPTAGGGYNDPRYPDSRYPIDDRYPLDDQRPGRYPPPAGGRYPMPEEDLNDRGRYPARYPERGYPDRGYPDRGYPDRGYYDRGNAYPPRKYPYDDKDYYYPAPPPGRHPFEYPNEVYSGGKDGRPPMPMPDRYKPDYDGRYPPHDRRVSASGRYPAETGDRYPYDRPAAGGRPGVDNRLPSGGGRYPVPVDDRYAQGVVPLPARGGDPYLVNDHYRPESKYGDRYPGVSENRFPVGNDRAPGYMYKYATRGSAGNGYDRYPMTPNDRDRGYDRYGPVDPQMYGSGYDRGAYDRGAYDRGAYDRGNGYGAPRPLASNAGYPYEIPYRPHVQQQQPPQGLGYDNSPNAIGDSFGGFGPVRPLAGGSRCDDGDNFKQMGVRQKVRRQYVRRVLPAPTLVHCQRECIDAKDFVCRSFNYRESALSYDADAVGSAVIGVTGREREREAANCELSDRDTRELDMQNPQMFDGGNYDYYERSNGRSSSDGECLDVSQTCNEEGMEFTMRTPEGFTGRIYTYGFYDRCFFRGNGGTANILRISGPQGYPECGTQRYGDTMTNIVVVQFADNVQTGRDKRFNLTCIFRGPGEAVVTSGYIGAGSGSPIPIEYLPAENTLSSKVRLMILYQNRPTTTIAVGDPLTFRLEPQDGYNQMTDIFATNVVARDPYSGRSIQLIDRYGCPVDSFVFPELDKLRTDDSLEARFNAFKIPESNFLVFEATVRSCRDGCQPAYCPGQAGRSEPSFGRRRRSVNATAAEDGEDGEAEAIGTVSTTTTSTSTEKPAAGTEGGEGDEKQTTNNDYPEHVREMIEVFDTRDDIFSEPVSRKLVAPVQTAVCLTSGEYHGLIGAMVVLVLLLVGFALAAGLAYRRYWGTMLKNRGVDRTSRASSFMPSALHQPTQVSHEPFGHGQQQQQQQQQNQQQQQRSNMFNAGLQKTFATGNLARMCQIPVINPMRTSTAGEFEDPSEPIYTDPSLFERSRV